MPIPQRELNVRVTDETGPEQLKEALASEGLPAEVIRRVVARTGHGASAMPRGRKVDLADDNDGSPYDGMHHALRDDNDDDDGEDGDQNR